MEITSDHDKRMTKIASHLQSYSEKLLEITLFDYAKIELIYS